MSDKLMYVLGHRMFLVPVEIELPEGDTLVSRTDGTWHRVDAASLDPFEVDADASRAWQEQKLASSLQQLGAATKILGELLTQGQSASGLSAADRKAGLKRLREASQGLGSELAAGGAEALRDKVAKGWGGPGADTIGEAAAEVAKDLDGKD